MKIPKKVIQQIERITLIEEVIKSGYSIDPDFIDNAPENWNKEEKEIFDMLAELEYKIKDKVLEILIKKEKL